MNYSVVLCFNMRPMFAKFLKEYTNNLRDDVVGITVCVCFIQRNSELLRLHKVSER
jgi:hypothetical protein